MMVNGLHLRRAGPADALRLAELRYEFRGSLLAPGERREPREEFVARCTSWMRDRLAGMGSWTCWVTTAGPEDGEPAPIIGTVWVQVIEKLPNPAFLLEEYGYVSSFFVLPEHRGAGIGNALLGTVLEWCDARPLESVILWPTPASRQLYARHGFRDAGTVMERARPTSGGDSRDGRRVE